ncbi:hypothetical protein U5801_19135 [Lamprobacter modestohalophilus]|uniref:hypothetical protein n=1 Tax=Lamprobacter modestohalophilus TaxID=1064514 RepID=UPI002ADED439|nr:hypothetical protein [Lamprobacter modestohalophilus]MEA1051904.1 hypothetical protein [Lamprobacter modestohalophilus]
MLKTRTALASALQRLGYQIATETSGYVRMVSSASGGSLYIKDNYISATGQLRTAEQQVTRTSSDSKGNPEWRSETIDRLLNTLGAMMHDREPHQEATTSIQHERRTVAVPQASNNPHRTTCRWECTGLYIAFPTSPTLKPIYAGYKTLVNNQHTKVGIARDSFMARKQSYVGTFEGEVEFWPIVEVAREQLKGVEDQLLARLSQRYTKVGRAREWFNTTDRAEIRLMIQRLQPGS